MRKLWVLALVACGGDPAAPFVGTWKGNASMTITPGTGNPRTVAVADVEELLTENVITDAIDFSECGWTAKVSGATLTMDASTSDCVTVATCTTRQSLVTGHATIKGSSMTWEYGGGMDTDCGGAVEGATYVVHADLTRQ